jgi:DNA-binding CsgD family transcriptional regulator
VAEGKTTEEVALIVGVSTNTANRYVAQAIQKLSAANRSKAVATAIRRGIL